jgi:hypothetical protein
MVNGPSWTRQGGLLQAGGSSGTETIPRRSQRTGAIWQQIPQNEIRALLEVPGSLHAHRSGIERQPQTEAMTTTATTGGFPSYPQGPRPQATGTLDRHPIIPSTRLPAHCNCRSTALGPPHKRRPPWRHHLPRGVNVVNRAFVRLARRLVSITGKAIPPVCDRQLHIYPLDTSLISQSLVNLPMSRYTKQWTCTPVARRLFGRKQHCKSRSGHESLLPFMYLIPFATPVSTRILGLNDAGHGLPPEYPNMWNDNRAPRPHGHNWNANGGIDRGQVMSYSHHSRR